LIGSRIDLIIMRNMTDSSPAATGARGPGRLVGRKVLVTGGGSGIGAASVRRLLAEGASVAAADIRADAATATIRDAVASEGGQGIALGVDVGDESSVTAAVAAAVAGLGGLDTVVASAGIVLAGTTDALALEEWEAVIRINLTGTFLTLKHALPHLCESGRGAIVTIGSVASIVAAGRASSYDASKGGVLQLTRAVAVEYADRGVRANCVCPGVTATNLASTSQSIAGTGQSTVPAPLRVRVPMDRVADPDEIAAVVAFLCSDDSSFVTGAAIAADGGYTAV
jgi:NAD(P)-dependent dehydrogenase (short-subunit alcohol dehydrogenase family)